MESPHEQGRKPHQRFHRLARPQQVPAFSHTLKFAVGVFVIVCALLPETTAVSLTSTLPLLAHLIAFPTLLGTLIAVVGLVMTITALRHRSWPGSAAGSMWVVGGLCFILFPAGVMAPPAAQQHTITRPMTIVVYNTGAQLTSGDVTKLVTRFDPDIMVFPESSDTEVADVLRDGDFHGHIYGAPDAGLPSSYSGGVAPTSMAVSSRLGPAHLVTGPVTSFGTVSLAFTDPQLPRVVGIHTAPPLPGLRADWKSDLDRVVAFGEHSEQPLVIAGDFNATLRHGALAHDRRRLVDSAQQCGTERQGTWPVSIPDQWRAQIDHVLTTPQLLATHCTVARVGSSDHAAYVTTVSPPR